VLIAHNAYRFPGGEEQAVADDRALLEARGHEVELYERTYAELRGGDGAAAAPLALGALWSARTYLEVRRLIRARRPDLVHAHNIFPLISPSLYRAARAEGVPVVQTLHNYRLICPASTLLRDGKHCELCVGHVPWAAVRYRCYRGSRAQSLALSAILTAHRGFGTWTEDVDAYIAPTEVGRALFVRGGLPAERIFVRPNAVPARPIGGYAAARSAIFVGRLSQEKGVRVLLEAWRSLPDVPLEIVGDGPLRDEVEAAVARSDHAHVDFLGPLPHARAVERVAAHGVLVHPSIAFETFGLAIVEAFSLGVPVIASRLGAQAEIVRDGVSGLLCDPGDAASLRAAVRRLVDSPELARRLSAGAAHEFAERFAPEASYRALLAAYDGALSRTG
jgi:glycosyltransferase involved in cell wall biosynthesis